VPPFLKRHCDRTRSYMAELGPFHLSAESLAGMGEGRAAGGPAVMYITRTAHSEALVVRGTGDDVDRLDQPWASLPLSADAHFCSCGRVYRRARAVGMGAYRLPRPRGQARTASRRSGRTLRRAAELFPLRPDPLCIVAVRLYPA
jgi:hypothetical protein